MMHMISACRQSLLQQQSELAERNLLVGQALVLQLPAFLAVQEM